MLVALRDAVVETCGSKAATLATMLRAGFPVPDGFVVPFGVHRDHTGGARPGSAGPGDPRFPAELLGAVADELDGLGGVPVAVRSSGSDEDGVDASAAGQYDSVLGVRGVTQVAAAVGTCWASLHSPRAIAYRSAHAASADGPRRTPAMAVIVHRLVDADVAGVMFTPSGSGGPTVIEAAWGLGPSVVGGTVTPDSYRVSADGTVERTVADKRTYLARRDTELVTHDVAPSRRREPCLDDATARSLAALGDEVAHVLGGPQDVEWAIVDGRRWVLQARPVTAVPPAQEPRPRDDTTLAGRLHGTPGSRGVVTGTARVVRGPGDFGRVQTGEILICPWTDPAWTPLLRIASGVVTETGGVLSHAAIIAREQQIPAVLGVPDATTRIPDGATISVDGTAGTIATVTTRPTIDT